MYFVIFALGLIIGILVRDIKYQTIETFKKVQETLENKPETQFIEPVTKEEAFKNSKTVDDIINNFNKK